MGYGLKNNPLSIPHYPITPIRLKPFLNGRHPYGVTAVPGSLDPGIYGYGRACVDHLPMGYGLLKGFGQETK